VFTDVYSKDLLQIWYHPIDINFLLLLVLFENGLFTSVLGDRAILHKNWSWKSKVSEDQELFKLRLWLKSTDILNTCLFISLLLLYHFFFPSTLAPQNERLVLLTTTLNDECNGNPLLLTTLFIFALLKLTFDLLHHSSFFLGDRMGWQRISTL
jgi:hypothetical protein